MSNQEKWEVVTNKKNKDSKKNIPTHINLNDPIISRQKEAITKFENEKISSKQIKYGEQQNPEQDWNYIKFNKPQIKPKIFHPQHIASSIKETGDGDIKIKKVSKLMAKAIVDARISKQWTQVQLARNSALDTKTIIEIERGGCVYNANVFNKLCKSLGIKIERNFDLN